LWFNRNNWLLYIPDVIYVRYLGLYGCWIFRDVIKTGTSETKTKTKTRPVKTKTKTKIGPIETKTKTKTTKKWSWTVSRPRPGLETNISVIKFD
jgi:hypothetical protein